MSAVEGCLLPASICLPLDAEGEEDVGGEFVCLFVCDGDGVGWWGWFGVGVLLGPWAVEWVHGLCDGVVGWGVCGCECACGFHEVECRWWWVVCLAFF